MNSAENVMFKILMYFVSLAVTLIIFGEGYNISLNIDTHRALMQHEKEQAVISSYMINRLERDSIKFNEMNLIITKVRSCLIKIDPEIYYQDFYTSEDSLFTIQHDAILTRRTVVPNPKSK